MHEKNQRPYCLFFCLLFSLAACGRSEQSSASLENQKFECADKICTGDSKPKHSSLESAIKVNNEWYIGPRKYFSSVSSVASFEWWGHKALDPSMARPSAAQELAINGKGYDISIEIFLRSKNPIPHKNSYNIIELADAKGGMSDRKNLRLGLERINIRQPNGPNNIESATYYVATEQTDGQGLRPILMCEENHPMNGGTADFMWNYGIWVSARMSAKHCGDWPEIYIEINRILQLLKKA